MPGVPSSESLRGSCSALGCVRAGQGPWEPFPPLRLLLFSSLGRMNTSSVTRQLWSIWEVLITMQHKKPSLCRLYQPLQSWKASSDPGGALELTKLTQKNLFIWTVHREQGGGLEGTPLGELHVVTWPSRGSSGCSELLWTLGGVRWGWTRGTDPKAPTHLGNCFCWRREGKTDFGYIIRVQFIY